MRLLLIAATVTVAAGLAATGEASAATYRVTSTADTSGNCSPEPAPCTLRQAFETASALTNDDTIIVPANTYNTAGALTLNNSSATVKGDGSGMPTIKQTIAGNRVLHVINGANLKVEGFTMTGGSPQSTGGAIEVDLPSALTLTNSVITGNRAEPNGGTAGQGAGIYSMGDTTIANSLITGNTATGSTGITSSGAGVFQLLGSLTITDSTISSNHSAPGTITGEGGAGGGISVASAAATIDRSTIANNTAGGPDGGLGAGLFLLASSGPAPITITNSTITGNAAETGTNNDSGGGGILSVEIPGNPLTITLVNTTLASNTVTGTGSGGNIEHRTGTFILKNTIISGGSAPTGSNCSPFGTFTPVGRNLESTDSCQLGAGDIKNTDPQLGPLADNGGVTQTMALSATSPALDAGLDCPPPATDQRGTARPQGAACDLGAFELVPGPPADKLAPVASALKFKPTKFAALGKGGSVISKKRKRKPKRGSTVSYNLSEAATVAFTVEKLSKGRKKGKRCTIVKTVRGGFAHTGKQGANKFKFSGRVGGKKLKPGSYRLVGIATDAAKNKGAAVRRSFRIVK